MPASNDPQRRPLYIDRVNRRLLSDPLGAGAWPVEVLPVGSFSTTGSNVVIGRYGAPGAAQELTADVTIQLLNTATTQVIAAARVAAGSTSAAGVLQLTDSTSSTSTTTAATPNAVKTAWDLANTAQTTANAALPRTGGTMTGGITFAAGQTIAGYAALAATQTFTAAQRGTVSAQGSVSGTVTLDFATANNFSMTLPAGGSVTLANPSNLTAGQSGSVVITQNGSTAATVAYGANWKFSGGTPTMSTGLSSVSTLVYFVESASRITAQLLTNVA